MIRLSVLIAFVALGALAVPLSVSAQSGREFVTEFHDLDPCRAGISL